MIYDLVIRGQLVLEDKVLYGEIGVSGEKVQAISAGSGQLSGKSLLDFGQSYVFAGMIDTHVHCYSNPDEGFANTSCAAAAGGVTTLLDMPYDLPNPINHATIFHEKVTRLGFGRRLPSITERIIFML